jgi:hypothetical protein
MPGAHAYCTVFDRNYAPRGLALYRSLERHAGDFLLVAICMDAEARELLERIDAPRLIPVGIDELEAWDPRLAEVRPTRSPVEYCWTVVPSACAYMLHRESSAEAVTYVDADLYFFSSPQPLFDELGDHSILILPHRMPDARDELAYGRFNVGWVTLRRDANGIAALEWWRERCLEWCYARVEPGRFGDQKYLDEWPSRFDGVKVGLNPAAGLGPWNQTLQGLDATTDGSLVTGGRTVVFFHYSGLTLHDSAGALGAVARRSGAYHFTDPVLWTIRARHGPRLLDRVWAPYAERWVAAQAELVAVGADAGLGLQPLRARELIATLARESAPAPLRDAHLGLHRRVMSRKASTRRPGSRNALPRG